MINPRLPQNLSFRVETVYAGKNNRIGRPKKNEHGVYQGLPMMVLGEETQQRTFYDPASMVDQITNPAGRFNKVFRSQKLLGEYAHPTFFGLSEAEKLQRLMTVDETKVSHLFTGIYTDNPGPDGTMVVRADIKPTGPYGKILEESLDDPVVNTAFSLRAYVDTRIQPNGLKYRTVKSLTTWDVVGASGFYGTDKAHAIGLENFAGDDYHEVDITILENGNLMIDQIALESFGDGIFNEILGSSSVSKIIQSRTLIKPDQSLMERFPNLYTKSILNDFFKEGK